MKKNVLITGANGMLASQVSKVLEMNDYQIRLLSRNSKPNFKNVYKWDIETGYIDEKALENVNIIVHLAGASVGEKRWTNSVKKEIKDSRVKGENSLLTSPSNEKKKLPQKKVNQPKKARFISNKENSHINYDKKGTTKNTVFNQVRLNKYIASSGICSRREADQLIELGEISVNGKIITQLGYKIKPGDVVKYGNKILKPRKLVYILLNKPKNVITTTRDPGNRKTVLDLVSNATHERIFPVGRLDRNTTGLLLLTNDGELADKLSHPSNNVKKIYEVGLDKPLNEEDLKKITKGVYLEDGKAEVDEIAIVSPDRKTVGIEIHSGKNRIVRRIFEHLGYQVVKLDRVMYANLTKKNLPRGHWRYLTEKEIAFLKYTKF